MGNLFDSLCPIVTTHINLIPRHHSSSFSKNSLGQHELLLNSPSSAPLITSSDFFIEKTLGKGSFGRVILVRRKEKLYAMKILKKSEMIKKGMIDKIILEKHILQKSHHPFIVNLKFAFQSASKIYLVMEYLPGGELFNHLEFQKRFNEETACFYTAEVFLGLDYLHKSLNIIYRDLKPQNILLTATGHIKIADFGLAVKNDKANSFAGTPEYLAPEIILGVKYNEKVDWWSLGILLYEMLSGETPFSEEGNFMKIEKLIIEQKVQFPKYFSYNAKDLINKLLEKDPKNRINDVDIKNHIFFENINWNKLVQLQIEAPSLLLENKWKIKGKKRVIESVENENIQIQGISFYRNSSLEKSENEIDYL